MEKEINTKQRTNFTVFLLFYQSNGKIFEMCIKLECETMESGMAIESHAQRIDVVSVCQRSWHHYLTYDDKHKQFQTRCISFKVANIFAVFNSFQ